MVDGLDTNLAWNRRVTVSMPPERDLEAGSYIIVFSAES